MMLGALLVAAVWSGGALAPETLFVSPPLGSDQDGNGSVESPFRTVTRALEQVQETSLERVTIRLDFGEYSIKTGEALPWSLPAGCRLLGRGSSHSKVVPGNAGASIRILPGAAPVVLDGIGFSGGPAAIQMEAEGGQQVGLTAQDLHFDQVPTAVSVHAARARGVEGPGRVALRLSRCRIEGGDVGIAVTGPGAVDLALDQVRFRGSPVGVLLPSEAGSGGVDLGFEARECQFLDHGEAGVRRRGEDGGNRRGAPLTFVDCLFQGNHTGIDLELPGGDTPLRVVGCRFLENEYYGIRAAGKSGDPKAVSRFEDCWFGWNGIGIYLVNCTVRYEFERCQVTDSLGNGVFTSSFLGDACEAWFRNCLLAHNGAAGLFVMSDGETMKVRAAFNTIVGNGGGGVTRKDRHGGATDLLVTHSILWGNQFDRQPRDFVRVEDGAVRGCLVADGQFCADGANRQLDPRFVNAAGRDYRPAQDSPSRAAGFLDPALPVPAVDLAGHPRSPDALVLGALIGAGDQ